MAGDRPGPAPTPSNVLELRGRPGHRKGNPDEPELTASVPRCPQWLSKAARQEWRRLARRMAAVGMLTELDRDVLAFYCSEVSKAAECAEHVDQHGEVQTTEKSGYSSPTAHAIQLERHLANVLKFGAQLGLTPSARSRVQALKPKRKPGKGYLGGQRA